MSSSNRWVSLSAALVIALSTLRVRAEPTDADREQAKSMYVEGMELREAGKTREALVRFKAAYRLVPSPITGLALGVAQEEQGDLVAAYAAYQAVLKLPPKATESNEAKTAREQVAKRQHALERRIPRLRVTVIGLSSGWTLMVDDAVSEESGDAPVVRRVNPGKHSVVVRASSSPDESRSKSVVVGEGEERDVELSFASGAIAQSPSVAGERSSSLPTIGFVGAGAFALVGTALLVVRPSKCSQPAPYDCGPDQRKADTLTGVAIGSFVLAAGGIALGVYGLSSTRSASRSAAITPVVGWGSLGLGGVF